MTTHQQRMAAARKAALDALSEEERRLVLAAASRIEVGIDRRRENSYIGQAISLEVLAALGNLLEKVNVDKGRPVCYDGDDHE